MPSKRVMSAVPAAAFLMLLTAIPGGAVTDIQLGVPVAGAIAAADQVDQYRVQLPAGAHIFARMAKPNAWESTMRVRYNSPPDDSNYLSRLSGDWDSVLDFTTETAGYYYLDVRSRWSEVGSYTLTVETDGTLSATTNPRSITVGEVVAGQSIADPSDRNYYRVQLAAGDHVFACLNKPTAWDSYLKVRQGQLSGSKALASIDGTWDLVLEFTAETAGYYYLEVYGDGNGTGSYTLTVETDGTLSATTNPRSIMVGEVVAGQSIADPSDRNYYRVQLAAGDHVFARLSKPAAWDSYLKVRQGQLPGSNALASIDGTWDLVLDFTAQAAGYYYLEVYGDWNGTGSYTLTVETDGTLSATTNPRSITVGEVVTDQSIADPSDRNYYRVQLAAGDHVFARLSKPAAWDSYLKVRQGQLPGSNALASIDGTWDLVLDFTAQAAGYYYLEVYGDWNGTGSYTLTVETDGTLSATTNPRSIMVGEVVAGQSIADPSDRNYYRVQLAAGDHVFARLSKPAAWDSYLKVRQGQLPGSNALASIDGTWDLVLDFTAQAAGYYYLEVYGDGNGTGSYTLTVETDGTLSATTNPRSIMVGEVVAGQSIADTSDRNYYRVQLAAGDHLFARLSKPAAWDCYLKVRQGQLPGSKALASIDGTSDLVLEFTAETAGYYYLEVYGDWNGTGQYQLMVGLDSAPAVHASPAFNGLTMLSVPVVATLEDPVLGLSLPSNRWARYNPSTGDYVLYANDPSHFTWLTPAEAVPGRSYFARFTSARTVKFMGTVPDSTKPYTIPLLRGWNMIGCPSLVARPWNTAAIQVRRPGQPAIPLSQAGVIVEGYAWGWKTLGGGYRLICDDLPYVPTDAQHELTPWGGYWILAGQNCDLILPAAGTAAAVKAAADCPSLPKAATFRITAETTGCDAACVLGIVPEGAPCFQAALPPSPPGRADLVAYLVDVTTGREMSVDLKSPGNMRPAWHLVVTAARGRVIRLSWDDLGLALRSDKDCWLMDKTTGKRVFMRTTSAYEYTSRSAESSREFEITVMPRETTPLCVTSFTAMPTAMQTLEIVYTLSRAADIEISLRNIAGREVAIVASEQYMRSGTHLLTWSPRSSKGQKLPSGNYLIEVRARDTEGRQNTLLRMVHVP